MMKFLEEKMNIIPDGSWSTGEIITAVILVIVLLLFIFLLIKLAGRIIGGLNPRKNTIFSHRKNKYKNRIGKKIKY